MNEFPINWHLIILVKTYLILMLQKLYKPIYTEAATIPLLVYLAACASDDNLMIFWITDCNDFKFNYISHLKAA